MDLRNMLNEPSSAGAAAAASRLQQQQHQHQHQQQIHHNHQQQQQQQQHQRHTQVQHQIHQQQAPPPHHQQQHSHSAPPPSSAQHHRPPPPQSPLQHPQSQHYPAPGYPSRQPPPPPHSQQQQQPYPPSHSPHGPSPANQYPYAPPSPHGGPPPPSGASQPPPGQHQYSYAHSKGPPGSYGPTSAGHPVHQSHPQYAQQQQQQQHQQHQQHQLQQQQHQQQHQHHPAGNSNAGSPLQPQFYSPHSPHQQQFSQHYQRHPNSPRGQRPPLIQTASGDRAPQHPTPSNAARHPRDRDRQVDRDRSISPKTMVYPEEFDREPDSVMRDDTPSGHPGSHPGGVASVKGSRASSHHRTHSQGTPQAAARRGSAIVPQQNPQLNQLQRNMDVDSEADGRMWNATTPATPVDRKGVNGFELGSHVRENSQALQTQNTPIPNLTSSNATSAVPAAHPLSSAPPPPPTPATQQQHHPSVNNLQRTITSSPTVKEQPQPFHPPLHHRSTPSIPPQPINRLSRPPSPKPSRDREIQPPPTPGSMSGSSRKRPRHDEMPIFARKASRSTSNSPVMPNRRGPPAQLIQQQHQQQLQQQQEIQQAGHLTPIQRQNTGPPSGGHAPPPPQPPAPVAAPAPLTQPPTVQPPNRIPNHFEHPLAPWEPSITNSIPYDEITHKVTEFIFNNVVKFDDPTVDWTNSGGPVIEIEAKLGHIIARNTNERLRIGIRSEAILDYFDYSFRSSMTEQQHKRFNSFLNDRFAETQPKNPPPPRSPSPSSSPSQANNHSQPRQFSGPPPRVPMEYKHTRERDTFRDLAPQTISSLPPLIQKLSKKPPRVRVTTDQQGKVIHKIIKCRIADLNVLSPCTAFDWRVSVNLEMPYTGGLEEKDGVIVPKPGGKGNSIERNKDRMSYKCLGGKFKVDLTQVTGNDHAKKEHELEIELDTMAVKRQGTLAMRNSPNGFEELVKGFVNNIRVLTRAVDG